MKSRTIHILMRFNDKLFGIGNVIDRHTAVLEQRGAVWIAKIGRPLGRARIEQINEQVGEGIASHLFLSQKKAGKHEVWRSAILEVRSELPRADKTFVPTYYEELEGFASAETWFKVGSFERVEPDDLRCIITLSSKQPIMRTLTSSMASLFIVGESDAREHLHEAAQSIVTHARPAHVFGADTEDETGMLDSGEIVQGDLTDWEDQETFG